MWLDAGTGTFAALGERTDPAGVDALVLTHVHGDHCLDFFPLFNLLRYGGGRERPLPVFAPEGVAARLAGFAGAGPGHDLFRVFEFVEVAPGDEVEVGGLWMGFGEAMHSVPTVAVRVGDGGAVLAYTADTGPGDGPAAAAAGADLLLAEATYQGRRVEGGYPYHLYAAEAGALAERSGSGRLVVTHVAPTLDPAASVDEAAAVFSGQVVWAAPGMEVQV